MANFFRSDAFKLCLFAFLIFLTRLPFLFQGYGLDMDSWSVATVARNISSTHQFEVSRFPGYPVQEFICSFFYNGFPFRLNLLTSVISTIGFVFFAMTLRVWRFKSVFLAASALAFVPIVYINSVTTIDYLWALAFALVSLYFVASNKPLLAGLFLGIAIGCRITTGAMLLCYSMMLIRPYGVKRNILRIAGFVLVTCITAGLIFLPVYLKYGISFLTYYDIPYPSLFKIFYRFTVETWGIIGFIGLIIGVVLLFFSPPAKARRYLFPRSINEKYIIAWLIAIDLYIIAFLRLPMEGGYLIPIIPFIILIFGKYLYRRAFHFFAITLIVSSFFIGISPLDRDDAPTPSKASFILPFGNEKLLVDLLKGPVLSYESRRKNGMEFTVRLLNSFDTVQKNSVVVSGKWYNQLNILRHDTAAEHLKLVSYLGQDSLLGYIGRGYNIYYLPQQEMYNNLVKNIDLKLYGAEPYIQQ